MEMTELTKTSVGKLSITVINYGARTRTSFCWKYFGNLVKLEDNKKKILNPHQVYCAACLAAAKADNEDVAFGLVKVKCYNKTVSTGNLTRHLRDDHQIRDDSAVNNIEEFFPILRPAPAQLSASKVETKDDKWLLARDLALWFCKSLLPFDSVSDEGMADFFKKYNVLKKEDELPSRYTVSGSALSDVYERMMSNVKEKIRVEASRHCAMSFDLWADQYRKLNYITFTLHYLTVDFELKSFTLSTQIVDGKKTRENIESMINNTKKLFGLDGKSIHAVTDASSYVEQAVSVANMPHHLCLGHALHNLVTVDGIDEVPEIKVLVTKCKKIVKAARHRSPELEVDAEIVQQEFLDALDRVVETLESDDSDPIFENDLSTPQFAEIFLNVNDVEDFLPTVKLENIRHVPISSTIKTVTSTRWHSVIGMLQTLLNVGNRDPINNMLMKIGQDELRLTQNEWKLLEDLVKFLTSFRETVEIVASQKTCTINVALVFRSEIIDILNTISDTESLIMFRLKRNMLANINKRFPVKKLIVAAALLDNRFMALKEIDTYLDSENLTNASFLASYIKEVIQVEDVPEVCFVEPSPSTSSGSGSSVLYKLSKKHSVSLGNENDPVEQECWRYLAAADPAEPKDGNLLSYWNTKKKAFPWISAFARAVLCVPVTSTPSERVFSVAGQVFSAKRSRLSPAKVDPAKMGVRSPSKS